VFSWLLVYLVIRVRRTGTPIFYGHTRIGQGGRKFRCWKFRTMVQDADIALKDLLTQPGFRVEWETNFKLKNDPRVTAIGAFLRRTSLDELPQLWNVLKGEMSLVGPRPIIEDELPRYRENAKFYLQVKPGITGLWQVSGRSNAPYDYRVRLDTWYVKNWGLWYDLVILGRTASVVLSRVGAY
jgi:Undecaprenyl-phosphate galactose phosphotransferase WbaP